MRTAAHEAWDSLERPWSKCLQLAWEALAVGTVPVGAVVVDPHGDMVTAARNGVYEKDVEWRGLLAHAEVTALMHLDPEARYERYTLYASLEPCLMCVGAAAVTSVGAIRYAGVDPYGGAAHLGARNRSMERLRLDIEGPLKGPFGLLAAALHVEFYSRRKPDGWVVRAYREVAPAIADVAAALTASGAAEASASGTTLRVFLPEVWDVLAALSDRGPT